MVRGKLSWNKNNMNEPIFQTSCGGFKITVFEDRISERSLFGSEISIPIKQIASVELGLSLLQQVTIETVGGKQHKLVIRLGDKEKFRDVIYSLLKSAKKCPFCAEEVQSEAVKCKHCHSDLSKSSINETVITSLLKIEDSVKDKVSEGKTIGEVQEKNNKQTKGVSKSLGCLIIFVSCVFFLGLLAVLSGGDKANTNTSTTADSVASTVAKEEAQKELDETMKLAMGAGVVTSYEFSNVVNVVYVGPTWYTQTVQFKKDFLAQVAMLKEQITGYKHFEARDAHSNEKVGEVTAFSGSLEVYK